MTPRRRRRRAQSGVTLLELMVVLILMTILTSAIGYGFVAGLDMQRQHARRQSESDQTETLERQITRLLQGAKLTDNADDATTFFIGATTGGGDSGDLGCDQITFTTAAPGVPAAAEASEDDFETQHTARGPVGGVAEVALSTTPYGDAGDRTGLFERLQRPSDGDSTQGGMESVLSAQVERIGFQFWDGQQWVDTWDTETGERRLPAAVRVSYVLQGTDGTPRVFDVPIPTSDVDAENPADGSSSANLTL